jgi:hypothetical protein
MSAIYVFKKFQWILLTVLSQRGFESKTPQSSCKVGGSGRKEITFGTEHNHRSDSDEEKPKKEEQAMSAIQLSFRSSAYHSALRSPS